MSHVEFLGPPGAGKSTIYSRLVEATPLLDGKDEARRRVFEERADSKYRLLRRLTPDAVGEMLEFAVVNRYWVNTYRQQFLRDYPEFVETVATAMRTASVDPEKLFTLCLETVDRYQMAVSTVQTDESVCLDEGFAQRLAGILWRCPEGDFSVREYFDRLPCPDRVIYVDAPPGVCTERQGRRGEGTATDGPDWADVGELQRDWREICSSICELLPDATATVTVENTGSVRSAVEAVRADLPQARAE